MSSSSNFVDFTTLANNWVNEKTWPDYVETRFSPSTLVWTSPTPEDDVDFHFQSSTGDLEFTGGYRAKDFTLVKTTIRLQVPSWGHVDIILESTFPIGHTWKWSIDDISDITGHIRLWIDKDLNGYEVVVAEYSISTPYGPIEQDEPPVGLFPTDPSKLPQFSRSSPSKDAAVAPGREHSSGRLVSDGEKKHWKLDASGVTRNPDEMQLLGKFLGTYSVKTSTGASGVTLPSKQLVKPAPDQPTDGAPKGEESFAIDQSFLGIFGVTGTIDTTSLGVQASVWVNAPIIGRVTLVSLNGDLTKGVTATIPAGIASGSVTIKVTPDTETPPRHQLWVSGSISVVMVGTKTLGDTLLLTLPF